MFWSTLILFLFHILRAFTVYLLITSKPHLNFELLPRLFHYKPDKTKHICIILMLMCIKLDANERTFVCVEFVQLTDQIYLNFQFWNHFDLADRRWRNGKKKIVKKRRRNSCFEFHWCDDLSLSDLQFMHDACALFWPKQFPFSSSSSPPPLCVALRCAIDNIISINRDFDVRDAASISQMQCVIKINKNGKLLKFI